MFDRVFKSETEINTAFADHLESLIHSRLPFDEAGIRAEWQAALDNFREQRTNPPWLSSE